MLAAGCAGSPSPASAIASPAAAPTHLPAVGSVDDWCASVYKAADVAGFNTRVGAGSGSIPSTHTGTGSPAGPIMTCTGENVVVSALDAKDDEALRSFWSDQRDWNTEFPGESATLSRGDVAGLHLFYRDADGLEIEIELAQGYRAVTVSLLIPLPALAETTARDQALAVADAALALPLPPIEG